MSQPHRVIRQLVVEALYESETSDHAPREVLERRLREEVEETPELSEPKQQRRALRMLDGVLEAREEADGLIAEAAPKHPVGTMAIVDRNILRLAIWELLSGPSVSVAAVVNEAVELARRYSGEKAPAFVNGVLRTVSAQIETARATRPGS
ncbi:MAG: transcription antitermination factor NusB [Dehalococcoidia bacterium]|nr:transcription antitermination factor NusB [Dehalococcoidia bacterium]